MKLPCQRQAPSEETYIVLFLRYVRHSHLNKALKTAINGGHLGCKTNNHLWKAEIECYSVLQLNMKSWNDLTNDGIELRKTKLKFFFHWSFQSKLCTGNSSFIYTMVNDLHHSNYAVISYIQDILNTMEIPTFFSIVL